jgi:Zn2+/Cd2+-exporting ATPase
MVVAALGAASIGVAMGAAGTDVALETADVVLMSDDLSRLPYAVALSRKTRQVIRQNLGFALAVITVLVSGTLLGVTTLPLGVVGHEGSTIVVVLNGLRLLRGVRMPGAGVRPSPRVPLIRTQASRA